MKSTTESQKAIDIDLELHSAEGDLVERLRRLPAAKFAALPWSIRKAVRRVKRLRAEAEETPGWPVF